MSKSILVASPSNVNSLADVLAESLFDEMVAAAKSRYVANFENGVPTLPWADFFAAYVDVWSAANGIDLSRYPAPVDPVAAEPDYDAMADWQTAVSFGWSIS